MKKSSHQGATAASAASINPVQRLPHHHVVGDGPRVAEHLPGILPVREHIGEDGNIEGPRVESILQLLPTP